MTVSDVITRADSLRPNTLSLSQKRDWIYALEMRIREFEVMYEPEEADDFFLREENALLCLPDEMEDMYAFYLLSMIAMSACDIAMYNNYTAMFNQLYSDWQKKFRRENIPTKNTKSEVKV